MSVLEWPNISSMAPESTMRPCRPQYAKRSGRPRTPPWPVCRRQGRLGRNRKHESSTCGMLRRSKIWAEAFRLRPRGILKIDEASPQVRGIPAAFDGTTDPPRARDPECGEVSLRAHLRRTARSRYRRATGFRLRRMHRSWAGARSTPRRLIRPTGSPACRAALAPGNARAARSRGSRVRSRRGG